MKVQIFMPKTYVDGVKLIKRPGKFFKKLGLFLLSIVVFTGLFFGGMGLANLLTNNNITWFSSGKISLKSVNYYVINFGEFDNEQQALDCSIWTASSGGAAYIYKQEKYIVSGQLYVNIDDVNTVLENFDDDLTYSPAMKQFKTSKTSFTIENLANSDKRAITKNIDLIHDAISQVLTISNNLDKNLLSNVSASSEINSLKSEVKIAKMELTAINANYNDDNLTKIINFFVTMEDSLDVCTTKLLSTENYSNVCKYCACELFFNYYDFAENF